MEAFTAAGLGLLEREDMEAVTLRRLAKELQTGPASLYAYVRTLQ
ncbi:TetR family transcriptional regulator [Streptomyces hygroscopicus]